MGEPTACTLWYRHDRTSGWVFNHLEKEHATGEKPVPRFPSQDGWVRSTWQRHHCWLTPDLPPKVTFVGPDDLLNAQEAAMDDKTLAAAVITELRTPRVTHHQVNKDWEPYATAAQTHPIEAIKLKAAGLIERQAAELAALAGVLQLVLGDEDTFCRAAHHEKADRHGAFTPCPIYTRALALWEAARARDGNGR